MMHVFPATYPVGPCCVQNLLINKLVAWFVVLILYCIDAGFWYAESAEWHLFCTKRTKMIIVRSSFSCFFNVIWICELSSVHSFSSQSGERRHCCLFRCTSFQKVYYSNPKHQELTVSINLFFSQIYISRRDRSHFVFLSRRFRCKTMRITSCKLREG
jgi:hypothetical protein